MVMLDRMDNIWDLLSYLRRYGSFLTSASAGASYQQVPPSRRGSAGFQILLVSGAPVASDKHIEPLT
jgi:hypothetical protein